MEYWYTKLTAPRWGRCVLFGCNPIFDSRPYIFDYINMNVCIVILSHCIITIIYLLKYQAHEMMRTIGRGKYRPVCKAWHERCRDSLLFDSLQILPIWGKIWGSPNPAPNGQQAAPFGAASLVWGSLSRVRTFFRPDKFSSIEFF